MQKGKKGNRIRHATKTEWGVGQLLEDATPWRALDLSPPLEAVAAPHPVADGFAQLILFGREIKVHDRAPSQAKPGQ